MTLTRRDPFREMMSMRDAMDRLFDQSFVRPSGQYMETGGRRSFHLPIEAYTTDDEVVIHAMLPGVSPDNVNINVEGNTLTISGEMTPPAEDVNWIMQETAYGRFRRTLTLNVPVEADKADAMFENGRLILHLPKAEKAKRKQIEVHAR